MIYGIGTDIVEYARIERMFARYDFSWHADSKAFIFLTAASSPIKIDSEMIAWPMLSSTMLGIATMG